MVFNGDLLISMGVPICFQNYSLIPRSRMIATMLFQKMTFIKTLEEKNSLMTNTVQDLPVTLEEVYQRLYQSMIIRNVTFSFQHIFGCWFGNGILLCFGPCSHFHNMYDFSNLP